MAKRGNCIFNENLQSEFAFLKKTSDSSKVYCKVCLCEFSIANAGRSDIKKHTETTKHKNNRTVTASSKPITEIFKHVKMGKSEELLAAREGLLAYHTVMHYHSFNSVTCTSRIIKTLYENKFTCGKTKCEAIITNVLSPHSLQNVSDDLKLSHFASIYTDASNHKNVKMIPILVRYFIPTVGIKVKLLEFESKEGETSTILVEYVSKVLEKYNLVQKIIGMCADNTNTNYGGSRRLGQNNLYFKLKEKLNRNIVGVGCSAHIIHNSIKSAADLLPIDFETIIVKIYSHFYIYTVRVESLKDICESCETEYTNLIGYCKTRFLELYHSVGRIIELYEPLKEYFLSLDKCPCVIKIFFENPCAELWLLFLHYNTGIFNKAILEVEGEKTTIFKVAQVLQKLKHLMEASYNDKFLPSQVKREMEKLVRKKELSRKEFLSKVQEFYKSCLEYIEEWAAPFTQFQQYDWMQLQSLIPNWEKLEPSVLSLIELLKSYNMILDDSKVYFELVLIRQYVNEEKLHEWTVDKKEVDQKWVEIFLHFQSNNEKLTNFEILIEFIFSLPGSNAPTERVFSKTNKIWTKEKSKLNVSVLKSLLITKCNFELDCMEFYDFLLTQPKLLSQIHSSEKYEKWL